MFQADNLVRVPAIEGATVYGVVTEVNTHGVWVAVLEDNGDVSAHVVYPADMLALESHHAPRHRDGSVCGLAAYSQTCQRGHYYGSGA